MTEWYSDLSKEAKPETGTVGELLAYLYEGLRATPRKSGHIGPTFQIYEGGHLIQDFIEQLEDHIKKHRLTADSPIGSLWSTLTYFLFRGIYKFALHEQHANRLGLTNLLNRERPDVEPAMKAKVHQIFGR